VKTIYRDEILDLYRNPRNTGKIPEPDVKQDGENPSCGDKLKIYAQIKENEIKKVKHDTDACAICTAATSILTEETTGLKTREVQNLDTDWMVEKLGIEISPMRMKCAVLGLKTLQKGLEKHEEQTDETA